MSYSTTTSIGFTTIQFKDISGYDFPRGIFKIPCKFFVKITIGEKVQKTTTSGRGKEPKWTETLNFPVDNSSTVTIKVYAQRTLPVDDLVGEIEEKLDELVGTEMSSAVRRPLVLRDPKGNKVELGPSLQFTVSALGLGGVIKSAREAVANMKGLPMLQQADGFEKNTSQVVDMTKSLTEPLDKLLQNVKIFTDLVEKMAEVGPIYTSGTNTLNRVSTGPSVRQGSVESAEFRTMIAQMDRDEQIIKLVQSLDDIYGFVQDAEPTKRIESQRDVLKLIVLQTMECAYFIRDYAKSKGFASRIVTSSLSQADDMIKQYKDKLDDLKAAFRDRAILYTEITVLRTMETVENIAAEIGLNELPHALGAGFDPDKACLPGTREGVMGHITDWVNSPDEEAPRILLLTGVAGSGKSSLVHTVAQRFHDLKRLGSSYCFDRARLAELNPGTLFSTIARDLACFDPQRKNNLSALLNANATMRTTKSVTQQFEQFLVKPGEGLTHVGPMLIAIDALDECGDYLDRKTLLSILATRMNELPSNFRILVTSRPENDVVRQLRNSGHTRIIKMEDISADTTRRDIEKFIEDKLGPLSSDFESKYPQKVWVKKLVEMSGNLFQWAATACRYIEGEGKASYSACERLEFALSPVGQGQDSYHLDKLYLDILERSVDAGDTSLSRFKLIVGSVMAAAEPLSVSSLAKLVLSKDLYPATITPVLSALGSLFDGVSEQFTPVRPLHTSLRDFLTDSNRSHKFYIPLSQPHRILLLSGLHIMDENLHFDMCKLPTSYLANDDIADLNNRIEKAIPEHLMYVCHFWGYHIQHVELEKAIDEKLKNVLYSKLLYWFEVMGLTKNVGRALETLSGVITKREAGNDEAFDEFLLDGIRFLSAYGRILTKSTPHLYLSALPSMPSNTPISMQFSHLLPNTLRVKMGGLKGWPALRTTIENISVAFSLDGKHIALGPDDGMVGEALEGHSSQVGEALEGHSSWVTSVAFSPDGRHIASGSDDRTVRVWDAFSSQQVGEALEGHSSWVASVAFSPDGKHIASGSHDRTVRVWDAFSGQQVGEALEGHSSWVASVAFSPDGKHIASGSDDRTVRVWDVFSGQQTGSTSGSDDRTVRVWDAFSGQQVGEALEGHSSWVTSVAFSPDGKHIASGSDDRTVRVWDAFSGQQVGEALEGHSSWVTSVAFSPDGRHIASGSDDRTVRVWDAFSGQQVGEALEGHSSWVASVAFSPEGKHIASGSDDRTVRVWDAFSGQQVGEALEGHSSWVTSVAFSPDGKHIASGSDDLTVRVWDVFSGQQVGEALEGHSSWVTSVAFSPDGRHIASGSDDRTLNFVPPLQVTFSTVGLKDFDRGVLSSAVLVLETLSAQAKFCAVIAPAIPDIAALLKDSAESVGSSAVSALEK
ncbi:WD40-repeat-containing domain protein [Hysterangium stoloniferum]|nr:WD40-repeat-containing domain protein [Hysterangium stoloniferum]